MPVGTIVTAYDWQATRSTLAALRSIVHALRSWPTPFGPAINTAGNIFFGGVCTDEAAADQLVLVGRQAAQFAITAVDRQLAARPLDLAAAEKGASS